MTLSLAPLSRRVVALTGVQALDRRRDLEMGSVANSRSRSPSLARSARDRADAQSRRGHRSKSTPPDSNGLRPRVRDSALALLLCLPVSSSRCVCARLARRRGSALGLGALESARCDDAARASSDASGLALIASLSPPLPPRARLDSFVRRDAHGPRRHPLDLVRARRRRLCAACCRLTRRQDWQIQHQLTPEQRRRDADLLHGVRRPDRRPEGAHLRQMQEEARRGAHG